MHFAQYCYLWVDGIHFNLQLDECRLCVLVVMGATEDGRRELEPYLAAIVKARSRGSNCFETSRSEACPRRNSALVTERSARSIRRFNTSDAGAQDGQRAG